MNLATKTNEERMDIAFTFIVILQEVIQKFIDSEIDNPLIKQRLKKMFNGFDSKSKQLNEEFRKCVRQVENHDDPEEMFDLEADFLYDLIIETYGIKTDEQKIKAISSVKLISNS